MKEFDKAHDKAHDKDGTYEMNSDTQSPVVSVVISTHNRAHLLPRAISSVLSQTYRDFELIIVDDASTDNTAEVVAGFHDERIKYIRHDANKGGPAARNTGIHAARGQYIALLDDDDEWLPVKLERQVAKMREADDRVGLIYSGAEVRGRGTVPLRTYLPQYRGNVREILLMGSTVCGLHTVLARRRCFAEVGGFDESFTSCQDWDMWKRISERFDFDFVPDVLSITHAHEDQISTSFASLIPGRTRMVEKHWREFQDHPKILVQHLKRLGKLHCLNGTWRQALYWFRQAAKINRLEWIKIAAWCMLELPMVRLFSNSRRFKKYGGHNRA